MLFGCSRNEETRYRRCVSILVLFGFALASFPIPLYRVSHKDTSVPFPCQNHPCGCASAHQCWTSCNCFTPKEKLAWAKANGITPPKYAMLAVGVETTADDPTSCSCGKRHASVGKPQKNCCGKVTVDPPRQVALASKSAPGCKSCQNDKAKATTLPQPSVCGSETLAEQQAAAPNYVISELLYKCQGHGPSWNHVGACILEPLGPLFYQVMPSTELETLANRFYLFDADSPPQPPPRYVFHERCEGAMRFSSGLI
jgi:hypothetical protein